MVGVAQARYTGALALEVLVWTGFGAILAILVLDVVCRYALDIPIKGAYELTQYLLAVGTFAALPLVTSDREHISVSLMDSVGSAAVRRLRTAVVDMLVAIILGLMSLQLWQQGQSLAATGTTLGGLKLPMSWLAYYTSVLAGASGLVAISQGWRHFISSENRQEQAA